MKGNPMARSMQWMAFCGLFFAAGICWGQNTPAAWPNPNPVRPENQPNAGNQPASPPNNAQGNRYPAAVQPNNPTNDRYPAAQPGNPADNRYQPGNQPGIQPGGMTDNRYPQLNQSGQPDQPVNPQLPTLQRRVTPQLTQPAVPPPFQLTPAEQAQVDLVLNMWEQKSKEIKTFDSKFVRWEYDLTLPVVDPKAPPGSPPLPNNKEQGMLKYAMPDKGVYRITYTDKALNGNWEPTPPERIQHWICDGNSVFEYDHRSSKVIEHPLPAEMKGKAIADGPLPFLFGAEADKLRKRYYFRILPATDPQKEVWLEAYPKLQQDAANFSHARLVLTLPEMTPKALQLILPGGKNYNSYEFFDIVVNDRLQIFKGNPFQAVTPRGWQKVTDPLPAQNTQVSPPVQAGRGIGQNR
jgi:TIGR03009 family protein